MPERDLVYLSPPPSPSLPQPCLLTTDITSSIETVESGQNRFRCLFFGKLTNPNFCFSCCRRFQFILPFHLFTFYMEIWSNYHLLFWRSGLWWTQMCARIFNRRLGAFLRRPPSICHCRWHEDLGSGPPHYYHHWPRALLSTSNKGLSQHDTFTPFLSLFLFWSRVDPGKHRYRPTLRGRDIVMGHIIFSLRVK